MRTPQASPDHATDSPTCTVPVSARSLPLEWPSASCRERGEDSHIHRHLVSHSAKTQYDLSVISTCVCPSRLELLCMLAPFRAVGNRQPSPNNDVVDNCRAVAAGLVGTSHFLHAQHTRQYMVGSASSPAFHLSPNTLQYSPANCRACCCHSIANNCCMPAQHPERPR